MSYFKVISRHLPGEIEGNRGKYRAGQLAPWPRFELDIIRIQVQRITATQTGQIIWLQPETFKLSGECPSVIQNHSQLCSYAYCFREIAIGLNYVLECPAPVHSYMQKVDILPRFIVYGFQFSDFLSDLMLRHGWAIIVFRRPDDAILK